MSVALVTRNQPGEKGLSGVCVRVCGYSHEEAWKHRRAASRSKARVGLGAEEEEKADGNGRVRTTSGVPSSLRMLVLEWPFVLELEEYQ